MINIKRIIYFILVTSLLSIQSIQCENAILQHTADRYGGIIIEVVEPIDDFAIRLEQSIAIWKEQGKRGIWLHIPTNQAELVPQAVQAGFVYHHALAHKIVLTKWLPEDEENILPSYATRTAGISAIVIDDQNRILVLKEKYHPEWGYKMPSGAVEMGENIKDAAVREVKEETGIDTVFEGVIAWCERHNTRMDNASDLFFACRLRPKSSDIVVQKSEVFEAIWMPLDEYKLIATGPQKAFMAALGAANQEYVGYSASDFSGVGEMTYYAPRGSTIDEK